MPRQPKKVTEGKVGLHIQIDATLLNEVRRLNPEYGALARLVRTLLRQYLKVKHGTNV